MNYFYIHPFKPQYFFPKGFKKHKVFTSFFLPYSMAGKISWALFRLSGLYRILFSKSNIEAFIPEIAIRKILKCDALMAFNLGTPGPEQKITGLGWDKREYFFIKYAQTPLAIKNVVNEHYILCQLSEYEFVPEVKCFHQDEQQVLLKTNVLSGEKLGTISLTDEILHCLVILAKIKVDSKTTMDSPQGFAFAHGDFCPWNMMMGKNGQILLFDWEMGGQYPVGYDLFTYIFQTHFLLFPKKTIEEVLKANEVMVKKYFNELKIADWKEPLKAFAKIKIGLEKDKGVKGMLLEYKNLLFYAEKA